MLTLRTATPRSWLETVLANLPGFLQDHAACERKASATGMAFVVRYPDRPALLDPMIAFAREELEHFHRVYRLMEAREIPLASDVHDPYVTALLRGVRSGRDARLLDRLLVAGVVEARGCERFGMLAEGIEDPELADFYGELQRAEARHQGLFLRLARQYFVAHEVENRLEHWLECEAHIIRDLPHRAALH